MTRKENVKIFLTDVDGTMTDGARYISDTNEQVKRFYIPDGMGMLCIQQMGIKTGIITTDSGPIAADRAKALGLDFAFLGAYDKLEVVKRLSETTGVGLDQMAFIGDDFNDYELLCEIGFPGCPADAQPIVKKIPGIYISPKVGGQGAVRDFINYLADEQQMLSAWTKFAKNR